ncbi:DNA-3-methyladenine glycosylase 2 family protein [Acidaminobacter sp. JC074]|uniref:DNA-3-methyladenine glycosylase 2 family protein n=1 Tax=Acidaminobacter sp. JC074 TaxID=2530199 RepID=UPI001F101959|nr:Ada metal-binding domain-containing protein [Acidaminobacter sp. JC074]MCH4890029.1 DNA-3-methyladenine glycosylase 2 family protein [Acidaminobacter sp. JC074]
MNIYSIARTTKDGNFDGQFYFGVKTTGIFCRPSCPCPIAKEENVRYFETVDQAKNEGFRPCKRCQPDVFVEHYQKNIAGTQIVKEALNLIHEGYLNHHTLDDLAESLHLSLRHLRSLFIENIGTTPVKMSMFKKAMMAKEKLYESDLSITDIAGSSGFGSLRQFNTVYKRTLGVTPSESRKHMDLYTLGKLELQLPYDEYFDFASVLDFLPHRITRGVEIIQDQTYLRTYRINDSQGYISVSDEMGYLKIEVYTEDLRDAYEVYQRMQGLFDLKTDFNPILKRFKTDPLLSKGLVNGRVPRLPKAFNPFELTIRAIINQQISIKATSTFMERLVKKANIRTLACFPQGLDYYFPNELELDQTLLDDIGLTNTRQKTIKNVTEALLNGQVSLTINQSFEAFQKSFIQVKGIGNWTINYVALRGLGMVDSFPAKDLGVIKALKTKKEKELNEIADKWRPYRGYATLCLWHLEA